METATQLTAPKRVGILGGSFDPIHNGHLALARSALHEARLDKVMFIPAKHAPGKAWRPFAEGAQRAQMVRLAIKGQSAYTVNEIELLREGPSYSYQTLTDLRQSDELFFILGSDALSALESWKNWRWLIDHAHLLVARRPGEKIVPSQRPVLWLKARTPDLSSSEIRAKLFAGEAVGPALLPAAVEAYIREQNLYSKSAEGVVLG